MKQNYLISIISIVALMLFSCTKDETSPNEGRDNPYVLETYASMVININQTTKTLETRALGDVNNHYDVNNLNVVTIGLPKKFFQSDLKFFGNSSILTVEPWITYIGKRDMAIVANDYGVENHDGEKLVSRLKVDVDSRDLIYDIKADINPKKVKNIVSNFTGLNGDSSKGIAPKGIAPKGITMTSTIDEIEIKPNISKEDCEYTGTKDKEDLDNNRFARNLERIVSKAVITYDEKNSNIKTLADIGILDENHSELGKCRILEVGSSVESNNTVSSAVGSAGYVVIDDLQGLGKEELQKNENFTGLAFSVEHSAVPIYFYANHAGKHKLSIPSSSSTTKFNIYEGFESAIHNWNVYEKDPSKVKNKIVRLGNLVEAVYPRPEKSEMLNAPLVQPLLLKDNQSNEPSFAEKVETLGDFKAQIVIPDNTTSDDSKEYDNEIYFFENSCENLDISKGFYRTAFAKVYATFIPAMDNLYVAVGENEAETGNLGVTEGSVVRKITADEFKKKYIDERDYTVYYGAVKLRFYTTLDAAESDGNYLQVEVPPFAETSTRNHNRLKNNSSERGNISLLSDGITLEQRPCIYEFKHGRCGYRIALNRQRSGSTGNLAATKYCDTRRNNIYKIRIDGFKKIGMPYDPMDPYDPYLPKSLEGDYVEGDYVEYPADPSIDKNNPYVAVVAKVIPWEHIVREVVLE